MIGGGCDLAAGALVGSRRRIGGRSRYAELVLALRAGNQL